MDLALKRQLEQLADFGNTNDAAVGKSGTRMLNITPDTGAFLSVLVRATLARRVLEIGTSNAYSTLWLADAARAIGGSEESNSVSEEAQQAFLQAIRPHAEAAAARLGVAPELVAAHAALESGWGRHAPGNNMFGIKAGGNWQGAVQALATLEVEDGATVARTERFRGYGDLAGSFNDYAGLLLDNPRYQRALNTGSDAHAFARALQAGGYATDPAYADKLSRVAAGIKAGRPAPPSLPR